jgi:putative membrane protein
MVYELIEWAIAVFVGGDVGQSYLGSQGDEWDAQKDMALATLGGMITIGIVAVVNWRYDRDFAREFAESLHADEGPLGEVRLKQLRQSALGDSTPSSDQ